MYITFNVRKYYTGPRMCTVVICWSRKSSTGLLKTGRYQHILRYGHILWPLCCHVVQGISLLPLDCWECGFESR